MADVNCRNCGEPWDTWGVQTGEGDLSKIEYRELLQGKGCPTCKGREQEVCVLDTGADVVPLALTQDALDEAHFASIEGEDSESWEEFCPMADVIGL